MQQLSRHQAGPCCSSCFQQTMSFSSASVPTFPTELHVQKRWELHGSSTVAGAHREHPFISLFTSAGPTVSVFGRKAEHRLPPLRGHPDLLRKGDPITPRPAGAAGTPLPGAEAPLLPRVSNLPLPHCYTIRLPLLVPGSRYNHPYPPRTHTSVFCFYHYCEHIYLSHCHLPFCLSFKTPRSQHR